MAKSIKIKKIDETLYYINKENILIEVFYEKIKVDENVYQINFREKHTNVIVYTVVDNQNRGIERLPGVSLTNKSLDSIIQGGRNLFIAGRPHHNHQPINLALSSSQKETLLRNLYAIFGYFKARDLNLALKFLKHYLNGKGRTLNVSPYLVKLLKEDYQIRNIISNKIRNVINENQKKRKKSPVIHGNFFLEQGYYVIQDYRYAFGGIDRFEWSANIQKKTVQIWFADNYEFHPVSKFNTSFNKRRKHKRYPGPGDDHRLLSNWAHMDMVELKLLGATDFWMKGKTELPVHTFNLSKSHVIRQSLSSSISTDLS